MSTKRKHEEFILNLRVSTIAELISRKYSSIDLDLALEDEGDFGLTAKRIFTTLFTAAEEEETYADLQNAIQEQTLFRIDVDVNPLLKEWTSELSQRLKEPDALQVANDYLVRYNPVIFKVYEENVSLDHLKTIWAAADALPTPERRFFALLIMYLLTKQFASDPEKFRTKLKTVEAFFHIRNYLVNDGDYPVSFLEAEFEDLELKSIISHQELLVLSEAKTLTAAGGVASAIQREDLEGKIANTIEREKAEKKKYNRVEKLEED